MKCMTIRVSISDNTALSINTKLSLYRRSGIVRRILITQGVLKRSVPKNSGKVLNFRFLANRLNDYFNLSID